MLYDEILNPILPNPRISTQRYVPVGLLTLPKTFAESPYAAFAGLANDNAAAPCAGTKRNAPSMSVVSAGDHIGRARDARETTTGDGSMDDAWRDATARDRSVRARRHRRRHRVRKRARKRATTRADIFTRIYHARVVARRSRASRTTMRERSDPIDPIGAISHRHRIVRTANKLNASRRDDASAAPALARVVVVVVARADAVRRRGWSAARAVKEDKVAEDMRVRVRGGRSRPRARSSAVRSTLLGFKISRY